MAIGRPPHFDSPEKLLKKFKEYVQEMKEAKRPLTVSGFCNYVDSYKNMLNEYSNKEIFSGTIKKIHSIIECDLEENALANKVNPSVAIFSLKNNFGWKDKTETELTGKDGAPLSIVLDNKQSKA